jgi:PKD repeat protein
MNNEMTDNIISKNLYGILLVEKSSNNNMDGCIILNNSFVAVSAKNESKSNLVSNSTLQDNSPIHFFFDNNSSIYSINTLFNKTRINFKDEDSKLIVRWYLHVQVISSRNIPISGAAVEIKTKLGNNISDSPFYTSGIGFVNWIAVTEYILNDTNGEEPGGELELLFTPFYGLVNIFINGSWESAGLDIEMNSSRVITFVIDVEKPIAEAGVDAIIDEDETYAFDTAKFYDDIGIANWTWDFGDGNYSFDKTPSHTFSSSGLYMIIINVSDASGKWDTDTISIFVNNVRPIADAGQNIEADEGEQIIFDAGASWDSPSDMDSLIFMWDFGDGTVGNGKATKHAYKDDGLYMVMLQVFDNGGATSFDYISVHVNNVAPQITPLSDLHVMEDEVFSMFISATDVDGDQLIFKDNSSLLNIDSMTGAIIFIPSNDEVGEHNVRISVIDDDGDENYVDINITVENTNDKPYITEPGYQILTEGKSFTYLIKASDMDVGDTITFTDNTDLFDINPKTGEISFKPSEDDIGIHFITITARDDRGESVNVVFTMEIRGKDEGISMGLVIILIIIGIIVFVTGVIGGSNGIHYPFLRKMENIIHSNTEVSEEELNDEDNPDNANDESQDTQKAGNNNEM